MNNVKVLTKAGMNPYDVVSGKIFETSLGLCKYYDFLTSQMLQMGVKRR